jgi:predicted DNA-binding protein (MmcQ/YjbR family)
MTVEEIRNICLSLKGTEESIKWENHLCFTIGGKMFFVVNPDNFPINGSFKTTPEIFDYLTELDGFIPAPYLAKHYWVQFDNMECFNKVKWTEHIERAYSLILEKLPLKVKKQISEIKNSNN